MTRIFIALAAIIATTAPLMAVERMAPSPAEAVRATPSQSVWITQSC